MNRMKSHLGGLVLLACAMASGASQATTFEAAVNWSGPAQPPLFQPHVVTAQGPNGASAQTVPISPYPEDPAVQRTNCGQSYYQICEANASSSPASMTTYAHNNGLGTLVATAGFADTFTNTSGQSQTYTFDSHLENIGLLIRSYYGAPVEARVTADIFINGVSVWNTNRSVFEDESGSRYQSSGSNLDSGSVNIGSFANGSSFTVRYVLSSYATATDPYNCGFECQEVTATIDDPFAVNAASAIHVASNVPEPETYALFVAGLAMVIGARRRAVGAKKQRLVS